MRKTILIASIALLFTNAIQAEEIPTDVMVSIKNAVNDVNSQFKTFENIVFSDFIVIKNTEKNYVCGQMKFKNKSSSIFYHDGKVSSVLINNHGENELMMFEVAYNATCTKSIESDELLTFKKVDFSE
jgi:hypothetical protein